MNRSENKIYQRLWREKNKERLRTYEKLYRAKNREKTIFATRKWQKKNPDKVRETNNRWRERCKTDMKTWARHTLSSVRSHCKKDGIKYAITWEHIFQAIPTDKLCPALGVPLVFSGLTPNSATVDKIIPNKGYIPNNIGVLSCRANVMKHNATHPDELRKIADYMESRIIQPR